MRPAQQRYRVRLPAAVLWLAAIAAALVGIDLAERFALYRVLPRDQSSFARSVRRPIKDAGLSLLHGFSGSLDVSGLPAGIPVFDFHLKPSDAETLLEHITRVRVVGTHDQESKDDVDARMRVDGASYSVRLKLRGRQHYHVVPPRPSLRVSLRHGRSYRGATVFNLVEPFDKTTDQVFLWEANEHGLIGWDATMGILAVDGRPLAAVQYVEQVRRETGDHALRPEGTFFRGTGELYSEGADPRRCGPRIQRVRDWLANPHGDVPFEPMQETFDLEHLRWFTALTEFSGDGHGFANFNMKGYCDPVSQKIELLIWDTRFGDWTQLPTSQFPDEGTQFLRNDRYRTWHDEALHALAHDRVEPMLERMRAFDAVYAPLLARDPFAWFPRSGPDGGFMGLRPAKLERTLRGNAQAILAALEGEDLAFEVDAPKRELRLATHDRGAKRLEAVLWRGPDGPRRWSPTEPVTVYGRYRDRQPVVAVALPPEIDPAAVEGVLAVNVHTGREVHAAPAETALAGVRVEPPRAAPPEVPALPAGFALDAAQRRIRVGPGRVRFDGVLRLPSGVAVEVAPGTELLAGPDAVLEIHGDLLLGGSAAAPIAVRGATAEPWGAVAVVGERDHPARVRGGFATFRGGAGSDAGSTRFTASLAIYFADVQLDHLGFEDSAGADALNVKYSKVEMRDNHFRRGSGDAVDYDFTSGVDANTKIEDYARDGIEASGSELRIEGARIHDARGRGLNLGEAARPEVRDAQVSGARIGCLVRDRADARVEGLTVARSATGVALLTEKPSFGPPRAVFRDLVAIDVDAFAILDHGAEASFEDAVRLGPATPPMRPFAGLRNVVRPGLPALPLDALFAEAQRARSPRPGSDADVARASAADPHAPASR